MSAHRDRVLTSLTSVGKSADPLLSGATAGAAESLKSTFFLMDGIPLPGSEPPLAHILNSDLLKAPEIAMGERLGVIDPGAVSVSAVLGAANRTWIAGFEARCEAQAFGEAQAIIDARCFGQPFRSSCA